MTLLASMRSTSARNVAERGDAVRKHRWSSRHPADGGAARRRAPTASGGRGRGRTTTRATVSSNTHGVLLPVTVLDGRATQDVQPANRDLRAIDGPARCTVRLVMRVCGGESRDKMVPASSGSLTAIVRDDRTERGIVMVGRIAVALLLCAADPSAPVDSLRRRPRSGQAGQAGGPRHHRRHHRHGPAGRQGAEPRGALHQDRGVGRLRRHDVLPDDQVRDHPGRRSGDEGSGARGKYGTGGLNLLKPEIDGREADPRRRVGDADPRQGRQRRHAVLHCGDRSARARRQVHDLRARRRRHARRAEDLGNGGRRQGPRRRSHRRQQGHDSRQAGGDAGAVLNRIDRGAGALSRRARHVDGRDHAVVHARQGAEPRAQLPAPRAGRRLRRHELSSRREGIRDSVGPPADARRRWAKRSRSTCGR